MDALSDVLRAAQLSGGVFLQAEFTAPWCVAEVTGKTYAQLPPPESWAELQESWNEYMRKLR